MTVRDRLVLTFLVVVAILVLPPLQAVVRFGELRELAVEHRAGHAGAAVALGQVQTSAAELDRVLRSYVATPSEPLGTSVRAAMASLTGAAEAVGRAGYEEEADPLLADVEALSASLVGVLDLVEARRLDLATDSALAVRPALDEVRRQAGEVAAAVDDRAASDFRLAEEIAATGRDATIYALFAALALAVLLSSWTTRGLAGPLRRLSRAMSDVAAGDLVAPADLPYERRDEIGHLASSFRTMTRRLDELDRLKAEFMGVAGHELKTPIDVVRSYTELIGEEMNNELTDHQREVFRRIAEQTTVMSRLVTRLMDISRLETGNFGIERETVDVEDLLLGLMRRFEVLARQKEITLSVEVRDDVPSHLTVDLDLIRDEVLGNLVANAVKFTPSGGRVRVEARGADGGVLVEVADTGPGIPAEHRPHIFERYYQVERSRAVGSGLGLAIGRQLAEAHGGWMRLVDDDGPGATFQVFLPGGP